MTAKSPRDRLSADPRRFSFDAALRLLQHAAGSTEPAAAVRFRSAPHLAYPGADVLALQEAEAPGAPPGVVTSVIGLVGATGVLPRGYTEQVTAATRERSPSLHAFIDMLADRLVAHFGAAGAKYRPARAAEAARLDAAPDRIARVLLSLAGHATPGVAERLACGASPLMHYGGFFAARPRSADRLAAMAGDWLGRPVEVVQFAGAWLDLPRDQRTALPAGRLAGAFHRLGEDAAIGVRAWDLQARVVLRVGPLDRADFAEMLPGGALLGRFVALVRAYLGLETGFAVNLLVVPDAVPATPVGLGARLGWNIWLHGAHTVTASEPLFEAELVEAGTVEGGMGTRIGGAG